MVSRALAASVLLFSMDAAAATIQVGPTRTFTEINQAVASLNAGDVVEVDGGAQYAPVLLTRSGSAAQPIRIVGLRAGGARPQIKGGVSTFEVHADHVVVEGFDLSGGSSNCFLHHGDDVTLRDSVVHDCPMGGIGGTDRDSGSFLLEYVEVHHTGAGASAHQIRMATDEVAHPGSVFRMQHCYIHDANGGNNVKSRAERNEIYYNWIEGALYHELELIGPDPEEQAAGWSVDLVREDSDVVGNVLRKTTASFVTRIGGDGTGWSKGRYRFVNNTIITASSAFAVWRLYDELESVEMHNNVIVVNGTGGPTIMRAVAGDFTWVSGTNIAGSNNWIASGAAAVPAQWTGTITGTSPGLANLTADVRPVAGSPLLDAGAANVAGPTGFAFPSPLWPPAFHPPLQTLPALGTAAARPVGGPIDIGAFEVLGAGGGAGGAGGTGGTGAGGESGAAGGGGTGAGGESGASGATGGGGTGGGGASGATGAGGTGASGGRGGTGASGASGATGGSGTGTGGASGATGGSGTGGATGAGGTGASGGGGGMGAGGASGATGGSGASGAGGFAGAAGVSGASGSTGAAGSSGTAGSTGQGGSTGSTGTGGAVGGRGGKSGTGGSQGTGSSGGCSCTMSNETSPEQVAPTLILLVGLCALRARRGRRDDPGRRERK
jgi:hypothetical protein